MKKSNMKWWLLWLIGSMGLGAFYAYALVGEGDKQHFIPGQTSHGHYQIELACDGCHGETFTSEDEMQRACVSCHAKELKAANDSHPKSKFTNPRNADRVAILDARYCVTCHSEHNPEVTRAMGVTLADDFCHLCHDDVAKNRPSHEGMGFDTCASAGCHNYHDNKALYEDFLVKHGEEPAVHDTALLPARNFGAFYQKYVRPEAKPLQAADADGGEHVTTEVLHDWSETAHAAQGVNCQDCHSLDGQWFEQPPVQACKQCHASESEGFLSGRHGMRLAQDLPAMTAEQARLPMKEKRLNHELGCSSCHSGHDLNTRTAAVEACLSCHDDQHSSAYKESRHFELWQAELSGEAAAGTGVSCATCHMPREIHKRQGEKLVVVQHNQNMTLRPNEKMIRSSCMQCHGLGFSIDALADAELIKNGFAGRPQQEIDSIEMALSRVQEEESETFSY